MQSDGGARLVRALNLVPESTSGAHEVRPYAKPFSFATFARESHSTASFRLKEERGKRRMGEQRARPRMTPRGARWWLIAEQRKRRKENSGSSSLTADDADRADGGGADAEDFEGARAERGGSAGRMQLDGGAHLGCDRDCVSGGNSGAHEVRPYGE